MDLGIARTHAVTTIAKGLFMCAIYASRFVLLQRLLRAIGVGMQVQTPVFSAIISVHGMRKSFTERASLVPNCPDGTSRLMLLEPT